MIPTTDFIHDATGSPQTLVVVGHDLDSAIVDSVLRVVDFPIVLFEEPGRAYSRIKEVRPQFILLCLTGDDLDGCQLLSILSLDAETRRIPISTIVVDATPSAAAIGSYEADFVARPAVAAAAA